MRQLLFAFAIALFSTGLCANAVPHNLGTSNFSQNWSNAGQITTNNDWSGVPSIEGYRGDNLTAATGTDPQTITAGESAGVINAIANQSAPDSLATGGVAEFDGITNFSVALNGSGTADAPYILIYINTTGRTNIQVAYLLRDLDGSADNSTQPVALQYLVGAQSGTSVFTNIAAAFVADASSGPSLATLTTPVSITLPAACENQSLVLLRIMTANAAGNDEWIGIDDISITSSGASGPPSVNSSVRVGTNPTNAASVQFTVSFSEAVTGVDSSDFSVVNAGTTVTGASVTGVTGSGTTYTVTVNSGTGNGTLRLDVIDDDTVINGSSVPLGGAGSGNGNFTTGESYTVDKTSPSVSSSVRAGASPTSATSVAFTVTFSESVSGVNAADFTVTSTGSIAGAAVTNVSGTGAAYTVTVGSYTGTGTIRVDLIDDDTVVDTANNALGGAGAGNGNFNTGEAYTIIAGTTPPVIYISEVMFNPQGTDPPHEYVEIRGTASATLPANIYLVGIESDDASGVGDVQTIFDLSGLTLGTNGYLVFAQVGNSYSFISGSTVVTGTTTGFGGITGFLSDVGTDIENHSVTFLLVQAAAAPALSDDIDSNNDGTPDGAVFSGWQIIDAVAVLDTGATDRSYTGASGITFSAGAAGPGTTVTVAWNAQWVGRRSGTSTGFAATDWSACDSLDGTAPAWTLDNTAGTPLTEPASFAGFALNHIGGDNFVPSINVTAPASGANWTASSPGNSVTWTTSNLASGTVDIQISTNGAGGPFTNLATGLAYNLGTTTVTAPATLTANAIIRVLHASAQGDSGIFNIVATPTVTVTDPTGATNWVASSTGNTVSWTTGGISSGTVDIQISTNGTGGPFTSLATGLAFNLGSTTVTSPATLTANAIVRVVHASAQGDSPAFNIVAPPAPTISGVNPPVGTTAGGSTVTITGTNFTASTAVNFGATPAASVTFVSATTLTVTTPALSGVSDVVVANGAQTATLTSGFYFTSPKTLTAGDLWIIAANLNAPDGFAFVPWVAIAANVEIVFTDDSFNTATTFIGAEQVVVWRAPAGGVAAGTVVTIVDATTGSATADLGTCPFGVLDSISASGDQVFAFQGDKIEANLLFGVNLANAGWVTSGATANLSFLPTALATGTRNFDLGAAGGTPFKTHAQYTGARTGLASLAAYQALIASPPTNWTFATVQTALSSTDFTVVTGTAPAITSTPGTAATVGTLYTYAIVATGTPAPTISTGALPVWLTLTGNTLSGTPSPTDAGTSPSITVTATNGVGVPAQQVFTITVSSSGGGGSGSSKKDDGGSCGAAEWPSPALLWLALPLLLALRRRRA